eukprot:TRINITY_DN4670_c0_g1_i2.p1 TRINITY_DN4670_c0_g1~~TRINITY_DN4670_c0_g1_i2.p1  ORF type:complete len:616 (+),score=118.74 TRINITY_DN4670_c0_g1_i2:73-1920(+)
MFASQKQFSAPTKTRYVTRVVNLLEAEVDDPLLLLQNVWAELQGPPLVQLICYGESSDVVEKLIHYSNCSNFENLLLEFEDVEDGVCGLIPIIENPYGSYVFDAMLWRIMDLYAEDEENHEQCINLLNRIADLLITLERSNILECISTAYGSTALKHFLQVLSGSPLDPYPIKRKKNKLETIDDPDLVLRSIELIKFFLNKMKNIEYHGDAISSLVFETTISSFFQQLILISSSLDQENLLLSIISEVTHIPTQITEEILAEDLFKKQITNQQASRIIEVILQTCTDSVFREFYYIYFKDNLHRFANHPIANYVVQCLIRNTRKSKQYKFIYDALIEDFDHLLRGRSGVLLAFLEMTTEKYVKYQKLVVQSFIKNIGECFNKTIEESNKAIATMLLYLANEPPHIFKKNKPKREDKFSAIGMKILTTLFHCDADYSTPVVQSFVKLPVQTKVHLCRDSLGSRLVDSFIESPHIKIRHKLKFVQSLRGNFDQLALKPIGSRVLERLFEVSDLSMKEAIANEMTEIEDDLDAIFHGKFILKNMKIALFRQNRHTWRNKIKESLKEKDDLDMTQLGKKKRKKAKRRAMKEILGEDHITKKRKRNEYENEPRKKRHKRS